MQDTSYLESILADVSEYDQVGREGERPQTGTEVITGASQQPRKGRELVALVVNSLACSEGSIGIFDVLETYSTI